MFRRNLHHLSLLAVLILSNGCGHYQLGTSSELTFSSLYIAPVSMRALIPQAQPILGTQLRESFLHDGRVTLVNRPEHAAVTLKVTVLDYHRDIATVKPGDTGLARKFIITLTADATLIETATGRILFKERRLVAMRDAYTDSGQQQAEYQLLPQLAQDLANKITHTVLDTW